MTNNNNTFQPSRGLPAGVVAGNFWSDGGARHRIWWPWAIELASPGVMLGLREVTDLVAWLDETGVGTTVQMSATAMIWVLFEEQTPGATPAPVSPRLARLAAQAGVTPRVLLVRRLAGERPTPGTA